MRKHPVNNAFLYLFLVLLFSLPFYLLGMYAPVDGLPFGLPISFLMIVVPFFLALLFTWKQEGRQGIKRLFGSVLDVKKAHVLTLLFCLLCMPLVAALSFLASRVLALPLPTEVQLSFSDIPLMFLLYLLGAIPEEVGWTYYLTDKLADSLGNGFSGVIIGLFWGLWHVLPWSWAHPPSWIAGMMLLNVLMRTCMVFAYREGGKSLFSMILFHAMINVSMSVYPNQGSHMNPWMFSAFLGVICLALICRFGWGGKKAQSRQA